MIGGRHQLIGGRHNLLVKCVDRFVASINYFVAGITCLVKVNTDWLASTDWFQEQTTPAMANR